MSDRQNFLTQIKSTLTPFLKMEGFRASGTTYRKVLGEIVHVINIQGSRNGDQCCVCMGIHLSFLPTHGNHSLRAPQTITEPECELRSRLKETDKVDKWWTYGTSDYEASASARSLLELYRDRGASYFARFTNFPHDFTRITTTTPDEQCAELLPGYATAVRRDLALARIYKKTGDISSAQFFAKRGLAHVGMATGLIASFKSIIQND